MKKLLAILILTISLSGCAVTEYRIRPVPENSKEIASDFEHKLGLAGTEQIKRMYRIYENKELEARLSNIGDKITKVCERPNLHYRYFIVDSSEYNAFSLPDGYIYITYGLIELLKDDDKLAAVIAHEIGHVTARHAVKAYERAQQSGLIFGSIKLIGTIISTVTGVPSYGNYIKIGSALTNIIIVQGYSRTDEFQADQLGMRYLSRAGYDPAIYVDVLEEFQRVERNKLYLPILSTHPPLELRIKHAKNFLWDISKSQTNPLHS